MININQSWINGLSIILRYVTRLDNTSS